MADQRAAEAAKTTVAELEALAAPRRSTSAAEDDPPPALSATRENAEGRLQYWCQKVAGAAPSDANNQLTAGVFDIARYVRDTDLPEANTLSQLRNAWLVRKPGCEDEFNDVWERQFAAGTLKGSPALRQLAGGLPVFERVWIETDDGEATWRIQIGGRRVVMTVPELMDQRKFNICSMAQIDRAFHLVRDRNRWIDHVNKAAATAEHVVLGAGVSLADEFREMLEEFVMNRHRAETRDELLLGRPWLDEDRHLHFFRMQDLIHLLKVQGSRLATESRKALGSAFGRSAADQDMTIRGKSINVFSVPAKFQPMPRLDLPPIRREPI